MNKPNASLLHFNDQKGSPSVAHCSLIAYIVFQQRYPPDSIPTDITASQYVSIQEKGVSAFEFEWDMESNSFVSARTEIQFFDGECCVQTNLPLPRNQDVYYWEVRNSLSLS